MSARLINRELSWLEFNRRVLALAAEPSIPLLERLKFAAICSSNLDEFFQVRVAALKDQVAGGIVRPAPDGMTAAQQLAEIAEAIAKFVPEQEALVRDRLLPALAARASRCARGTTSPSTTASSSSASTTSASSRCSPRWRWTRRTRSRTSPTSP